jgi:hypothetical protein
VRIKQALVAPPISYFKKNFLYQNNLVEYFDINQPCIFFGASHSSNAINNHNSYKIILPATPYDYPNISNYDKTIFICSDKYLLPEGTIRKSLTPKIKDYSLFKPSVMGDKIYTYSGFKNGWNLNSDLIKEIQKNIDFEIITTDHLNIKDYHEIDYLKTNFYDKSFLCINLTQGNGLSTAIELGLMGRKTIFKNSTHNSIQRLDFPNFISYNNIDDIIKIIKEESYKIGTIQDPIDAHNIGDDWLDLDFYL